MSLLRTALIYVGYLGTWAVLYAVVLSGCRKPALCHCRKCRREEA